MSSLRGRIGLVGLILGLAVAGCGSSSKSSSSTSVKPALTKAQFLVQANAICKAGNAKTQARGRALGNNPSRAQIVSYVTKFLAPEIQSQINAVRALAVQTADSAKLTSMLDLAQADLDKVKANPLSIATNASPFHNFGVQAHAYGLTQCAANS